MSYSDSVDAGPAPRRVTFRMVRWLQRSDRTRGRIAAGAVMVAVAGFIAFDSLRSLPLTYVWFLRVSSYPSST